MTVYVTDVIYILTDAMKREAAGTTPHSIAMNQQAHP